MLLDVEASEDEPTQYTYQLAENIWSKALLEVLVASQADPDRDLESDFCKLSSPLCGCSFGA